MTPSFKITPCHWMLYPECRRLMDILCRDSAVPAALFVGGCVRNLLCDQEVKDLDLATVLTPEQVIEACRQAGFKTIPTGLQHGTVTVLIGERSFEITTLRRDVSTDGRHATVAYTHDWYEDVLRRDFTMNTLLADLDGNVYDLTGQGISDLRAGRVVFVGVPEQRIQEDYLRILRFYRFHGRYGRGDPDQNALAACQKYNQKISTLSKERISQEFFQIIMQQKAAQTLRLMHDCGALSVIIPQDMTPLSRLINRQECYNLYSLDARLYILADMRADYLQNMEKEALILTRKQKNTFEKWSTMKRYHSSFSQKTLKEMVYRYDKKLVQQLILMMEEPDGDVELCLYYIRDTEVPIFPITGKDLLSLGVTQGDDFGKLLRNVEAWWISKDFLPDRKACLAYIERAMVT